MAAVVRDKIRFDNAGISVEGGFTGEGPRWHQGGT